MLFSQWAVFWKREVVRGGLQTALTLDKIYAVRATNLNKKALIFSLFGKTKRNQDVEL
jgi:hypothetical protein